MGYKLYVDGQLGIPYENLEEAVADAEVFESEGYDTVIVWEDRDGHLQEGASSPPT